MGFLMSFAYMPFYTGDYYRDTRHLSMLQHGAYRQLLDHCWDQKGPLPLDMTRCFRICGAVSKEEQDAVYGVIAEFFVRMEDGHYNRRMQREIERAASVSGARSDAAHTRWKARESIRSIDAASRDANAMQVHSKSNASAASPSPSPYPSPYQENLDATHLVPAAAQQARIPRCPTEEIIKSFHKHLPMLPAVVVVNASRKAAISARWREVVTTDKMGLEAGIEWFDWFFAHAAKSRFLTGRTTSRDGRSWHADLDWLMKPVNFAKTIEGNYHKEAA
jgi:uncharacterized protein YdaU (DUF1376 family)